MITSKLEFDFTKDPYSNFAGLINNAVAQKLPEPTAFCLSTTDENKIAHGRMLLFKGVVRGGFSFYSHYDGRKALQMQQAPNAAMTYFLPFAPHQRQIRIEGIIEKLTAAESDQYFSGRERLSQIGAWASDQSKKITSQDEFHQRVSEFEKKFAGQDIPRPETWGGFLLQPLRFEFWFAQPGRLHERYCYERVEVNATSWDRFLRFP